MYNIIAYYNHKKGRFYFIIFNSNFKDTNFDFDRTKAFRKGSKIYVNAFFIEDIQTCPKCNSSNISKNGYVYKNVLHCTDHINLIYVKCHIQRYKCKDCFCIFKESETFSIPNGNLSRASIIIILEKLRYATSTFESVARDLHISRQDVINVFDRYFTYSPGELPEIISFDEKHVNKSMTDNSYLFVIVDFVNKCIYDILPSRHKEKLEKYFQKIPKSERDKVKYITMDMWEPYKMVAKMYFKNAKIAVDSFHVMENINRAMNKVRTTVMQKFNQNTDLLEDNHIFYYFLKKFHFFFTMEFDDITDKPIKVPKLKTKLVKEEILKYLLSIDDRLNEAYKLTSKYREFNRCANIKNCSEELEDLIDLFLSSKISHFFEVGKTLLKWKDEIINSFTIINDRRLSNGLIEGLNSIISQINMNGKGYSNFFRFKLRIIYVINKNLTIKNK